MKDSKRRLPFLTFYYFLLELCRQAVEPFRDSEYANSVDTIYVYFNRFGAFASFC